ncbi:hypothetical protein PR202_gb12143 [Eleusine coracana subsp. coracana]|uniref:Uncharacterized protein n=1 Tax=Eleusine coracana subsp. coracana TaxID=191504 RepID=A0AAV5EQ95_ELECO|nr:hypothetical protein QOZ80_7BG0585420 [Eleusine coracana subsp. coracana]GJN24405.1 hypothetical protein PR202_gb12143 [Eleusine coracana subsp. coracana]
MSKGGSSKVHQLSWLWRGPRRALGAARDLYVRSLTGCAGHMPPGNAAFGYPAFGGAGAPEYCFSASSSRRSADVDDDLRDLIRAVSQRRAAEAAAAQAVAQEPAVVPRSQSVAMARIDEDRPCEFGDVAAAEVLPRSQSCAVAAGRRAGGRRRGGRVAAVAA